MIKECIRCYRNFKAKTTAKYCPRCRVKVKLQQTRDNYTQNKERYNKNNKRWLFFNREKVLKRMKKWRFAHSDYQRDWRHIKNPKPEPQSEVKSYSDYLKESGYKEPQLTPGDFKRILAYKPRDKVLNVWRS